MKTKYYDFDLEIESEDIETIFPDWDGENEKIVVYSPHDDDALLGTGYLLSAAMDLGAEAYVFIVCNGSCGYSKVEDKDDIVQIRREESRKAYKKFGIDEDNIVRFEYPDFSAFGKIGWKTSDDEKGAFEKAIRNLREIKATRVLVPNEFREHLDHEAASKMGSYHGPQAGDPVVVDWGEPNKVRSVLKYTVWADFSPMGRLVQARREGLRANCGIRVDSAVEDDVREALEEYESQQEIISGLMKEREDRKMRRGYIEVYRKFDPRPSIEYGPYKKAIEKIE